MLLKHLEQIKNVWLRHVELISSMRQRTAVKKSAFTLKFQIGDRSLIAYASLLRGSSALDRKRAALLVFLAGGKGGGQGTGGACVCGCISAPGDVVKIQREAAGA